ncbi:hypothetical protein M231_02531 [Tremella mesenterica]|uniref:Polynucleotide 5'-hydroxyl-kinase GRC3 n=1 Tax=Tremella mesenterica TaxID=5217 RepID=A0A4V1M4G2_TREME|nr:uncharacterized protein TREMEDRAFT_45306 [Tremella mesenterica DSM 1558]EIW67326.1 hypothetical protein TREMEDRAFT_45306 [Tremella mesenterica DSM 1558]RXK40257.1 hypothetical protein M231_02531 [Tremella mesenterica]
MEYEALDIDPGVEWRFELEADEEMAVRVASGSVSINAEELPPSTWYPIHKLTKSAIYAHEPAQIEVSSLPASHYASSSTNQSQILSLHLALEQRRILAKRVSDGTIGPRVMLVGPTSSGKTTVAKNLVNLALSAGMGWTPCVVGLDPSSPANLIPGSISLSLPSHPLPTHHVAHPFGSSPTSLPSSTLAADVSTVGWWYGHTEPSTKGSDIWKKLVSAMGERWKERCAKDPIAAASGLIMDTPSAFTNPTLGTKKDDPKARYALVLQAIQTFDIDVIVVIGHEKLTIDLLRLLPSSIKVLRLPKSGGVVDNDDTYRELVHAFQVRCYFYGEPPISKTIQALRGESVPRELGLTPYSFQIGWETLIVLRVGEEHSAPSSALPLGSSRMLSPTRLTRVDPSGPAHTVRLLNTVLAIVAIRPDDRIPKPTSVNKSAPTIIKSPKKEEGDDGEEEEKEEDDLDDVPYKEEVGWREVLGFVVITNIDSQRRKYTLLSPTPGKLPSTVAIAGSVEWVDSE